MVEELAGELKPLLEEDKFAECEAMIKRVFADKNWGTT